MHANPGINADVTTGRHLNLLLHFPEADLPFLVAFTTLSSLDSKHRHLWIRTKSYLLDSSMTAHFYDLL